MTTESRNTLFCENYDLINKVINTNYRLIKALYLDRDDVSQELSICMLSAIEKFDPTRSASIRAHLWCSMQYEILNIKRAHRPHGISSVEKNMKLEFSCIDNFTFDGLTSYDDISLIETSEFAESLSAFEAEILDLKINGFHLRKNKEKATIEDLQERYSAMYEMEGSLLA